MDINQVDTGLRGNVLVVEDQQKQRESVVKALKRKGLNVKEAATGVGAVRICKKNPIDIVILDYRDIGDLDGIQVAAILISLDESISIISHTAYGDTYQPLAEQQGLTNIVKWIFKRPKSIEVVIETVDKLLLLRLHAYLEDLLEQGHLEIDYPFSNPRISNLSQPSNEHLRVKLLDALIDILNQTRLPEISNDVQQRHILLSRFYEAVRDEIWDRHSTAAESVRNLVHMLKGATRQQPISDLNQVQISVLLDAVEMLKSQDISTEDVDVIKSKMQDVGLDPVFRAKEKLANLKKLYRNDNLSF